MINRRFVIKFFALTPFISFTKLFGDHHLAFTGRVFVNGRELTHQTKIKKGDEIETLKGGSVRFKINKDAFLLRENTKLKVEDTSKKVFSLITGGVLSVFEKGEVTINTPTAVAGIRGTGLYIEAEDRDTTYICTCYGEIKYDYKGGSKVVKTTHHESPFRFKNQNGEVILEKAPVINHTDEELIVLEEMVQRRPPFVDSFDMLIRSIKKFFGMEIKSSLY